VFADELPNAGEQTSIDENHQRAEHREHDRILAVLRDAEGPDQDGREQQRHEHRDEVPAEDGDEPLDEASLHLSVDECSPSSAGGTRFATTTIPFTSRSSRVVDKIRS